MARRRPVGRLAAALAGTALLLGTVGWAVAGTRAETICERYGTVRTAGGYVAQNNVWGADTPQCIDVAGDGLTVTRSAADRPTHGPPASYPSLLWGCHHGTCTDGFAPVRLSSPRFAALHTSAEFTSVDSGVHGTTYDLWLDPTPRTTGQVTGAEIMIWLARRGGVQPVGRRVGTVQVAGAAWEVWFGNDGWNVVSYVRTTAADRLSTPLRSFTADAVRRGYAGDGWYLTSVQAGFELWSGGEGLRVSSFTVTDGPR